MSWIHLVKLMLFLMWMESRKTLGQTLDPILTCNFERELCQFTQDQSPSDDFDWVSGRGPTEAEFTGPLADNTFKNETGTYLYIQSNEELMGTVARVRLLTIPVITQGWARLEFFYHMSDRDGVNRLGTLRVEGCSNPIWSRTGDQGNLWLKTAMTFKCNRSNPEVVFEAIRGGRDSDIAIDDIVIYDILGEFTTPEPYVTPVAGGTGNTDSPSGLTTSMLVITIVFSIIGFIILLCIVSTIFRKIFMKLFGWSCDIEHLIGIGGLRSRKTREQPLKSNTNDGDDRYTALSGQVSANSVYTNIKTTNSNPDSTTVSLVMAESSSLLETPRDLQPSTTGTSFQEPLSNTLPTISKTNMSDKTCDDGFYLQPLSRTLPMALDQNKFTDNDSKHHKLNHDNEHIIVQSTAEYIDIKFKFPSPTSSAEYSSQQAQVKQIQGDATSDGYIEFERQSLQEEPASIEEDVTCTVPIGKDITTPNSLGAMSDRQTYMQPISKTLPKTSDKSNSAAKSDNVDDNEVYLQPLSNTLPANTRSLESETGPHVPARPNLAPITTNIYASVKSARFSTGTTDLSPQTSSSPIISRPSKEELSVDEISTDQVDATYSEPFTQRTSLSNMPDNGTYLQPNSNDITANFTSDNGTYLQPNSNMLTRKAPSVNDNQPNSNASIPDVATEDVTYLQPNSNESIPEPEVSSDGAIYLVPNSNQFTPEADVDDETYMQPDNVSIPEITSDDGIYLQPNSNEQIPEYTYGGIYEQTISHNSVK